MRHGSAFEELEALLPAEAGAGDERIPPGDAQSLGRRLIAFARIAAAMHADAFEPPAPAAEPIGPADLSLSAMLGRMS